MPILPLDHPEPFAARLGVMLYPGTRATTRVKPVPLLRNGWPSRSVVLTKPVISWHTALCCVLASWNNVIRIAELTATRANASGSRSALWDARRRFLSVAHLWGAWSIRKGRFETRPEVEYDGVADFQSFLTEAEILRQWGQRWRPPRPRSKPFLPPCVWQVPANWEPLPRQPGWPDTGKVPVFTLPEGLLAGLKPAGRPRKVG
jgi:hypothetical protein